MTAACLEVKSKGKIVNGFLAFLSETLSTEYWKNAAIDVLANASSNFPIEE